MAYGEWCPNCGNPIVSVTRGIPSMGTCSNGHITDRRDCLRREPVKEDKEAIIEALTARAERAEAALADLRRATRGQTFTFDEGREWKHRAERAEAALATARDDALEEAAWVAIAYDEQLHSNQAVAINAASNIASAIRAMKGGDA